MMRSFLGLSLVLVFLLVETQGFSWPHWGRCPSLDVKQEFKLKGYMGRWYIQAGYNLEMTQGGGRCGQATYELDRANSEVNVTNMQISDKTNKWESISGYAVPKDYTKDEGKFIVHLYKWGFWKVTAPYWVLGTDYKTYSVVYSCENFLLFFHYYSSWLLSRDQHLNKKESYKFYSNVDAILEKNKISPAIFKPISQDDCDT